MMHGQRNIKLNNYHHISCWLMTLTLEQKIPLVGSHRQFCFYDTKFRHNVCLMRELRVWVLHLYVHQKVGRHSFVH